ncbi:MAG: hypothetical protein SF028_05600 [Candidatus Sumerlaeia bacterium]|nr:hypothetical protein [Candidatus Sumerlaeia bacterium]
MSTTPPPLPPPGEPQPPQQPYAPYPPPEQQPYGAAQQPFGYDPAQQPYGYDPQQQGYAPYGPQYGAAPTWKHAIGGMVGTALGVLAVLMMGIGVVVSQVIGAKYGGDPMAAQGDPLAIFSGFLLLGGMAAGLLGVVASIIGFFERDRKRLFAWIGLGINGLPLCCVGALTALGVAALLSMGGLPG